MNKIRFLNLSLVVISSFLLVKTSEAPYWFGYSAGVFEQLSSGNVEVFSVAASVLAAYIFYAVNILIPSYINRKKALGIISAQLTQVVYRCMCLLYIHKECSKYLPEKKLKHLYKIISYDLSRKLGLVDELSENLTIEERGALNKIRSSKDKFFMSERSLEASARNISNAAIHLVKSIKLPPAHDKDKDWFKITGEDISFIRTSSAFELFLAELIQSGLSEVLELPDVIRFVESVTKDQDAPSKQ